MHLIELLLPVLDNQKRRFPGVVFVRVEEALASRFGGFTAFDRNPAKGLSEVGSGHLQRDEIIIFEVMVDQLDREWWRQYKAQLERDFEQTKSSLGPIRLSASNDPSRNDNRRDPGGASKPTFLQVALSWGRSEEEAEYEALHQWSSNADGEEICWDLRRTRDFDAVGRLVSADRIRECVLVSADLGRHRAWLGEYAEMGFAEIYLHHVGRTQVQFIEEFGSYVLPAIRRHHE